MSAGGLDPYDDDDHRVLKALWIWLSKDEVASLERMAKVAGTTNSMVVQAIMRDVIANEMAEQGAEKAA